MSTNGDKQYGYDYSTNADTTLNILAVNAFRRVAAIASLLGETSAASIQLQRAAALAAAVNRLVVERPGGLYVDGLRSDGHAEYGRLAVGQRGGPGLRRGPGRPDPDGGRLRGLAQHLGGARPRHGAAAGAARRRTHADVVRLLTDASFPGWAAIIKDGGTFTWETWTPSDLIGDSMSHGWGSSALVAMQEALLGAVPVPARRHRTTHPGDRHSSGCGSQPRFGDVPDPGRGVLGGLADLDDRHGPVDHRSAQRRGRGQPAGGLGLAGDRRRRAGRCGPRASTW